MNDVQKHTKREIKHFFNTYKDLQEDKEVTVGEFYSREEAVELIKTYQENYKKSL